MVDALLLNPLANIKRRHVHFLRDWCGGEYLIYPPLDLAYVAAVLRRNNIGAGLIDASALHMPHKKVIEIVKKEKPMFIGIPSTWQSYDDDLELSRMLKKAIPSVKIILSGPNVTLDPQMILTSEYIDYCILGELERPFLDIIRGEFTNNIAYKINGKIIIKERLLFDDLDSLPFPARDLLPNGRYWETITARNPFTTMITSRGCPYKCSFCQVNIWNLGKIRFRSIGNIMEEIGEIVNKFKIPQIIFRDQIFTVCRDRVIKFCEEIIKRKYDISWACFSCVDTVDRELLQLMKKAGCHQICYGFESGNQHILDLSKKGITVAQSKQAVKLTKEAGIEIIGYFMLGMHGDTKESMRETLNLAIELDCDYTSFSWLMQIPPSKFSKPSEDNKILNKKLKAYYRKFYFRIPYIYKRLKNIRTARQFFKKIMIVLKHLL